MKNPSGNKLEKLVFGMFDQMVEGADKYVTKQGSTWLIFTEDKRWVIEFTNDKTLWFNYNLFQGELELIGKDCVEERDLIKNWFESRFLNKPKVKEAHHVDVMKFFDKKMENIIENGVKHTRHWTRNHLDSLEDTIQNGVKETIGTFHTRSFVVEDTIQNEVKHTWSALYKCRANVEDTIQNGVKNTLPGKKYSFDAVEDTIQNGVKNTTWRFQTNLRRVEDTIQNGVKETKEDRLFRTIHVMNTIKNGVKHVEDGDWLDQDERIDDIIENGVKHTQPMDEWVNSENIVSDVINVGVKEIIPSTFESEEQKDHWKTNDEITESVKDVIENGVKEMQPLPAQDGNRDWSLYYQRQAHMTKPHTEYVKEVIEDSYNHMGRVEGVIRNTDKDGI